jgi:hypothetical protein
MPLKRTYFHRSYAIAHRVFGSEATDEMIHQFCITRPGDAENVLVKPTLEEAKAAIDQIVDLQLNSGSRAAPLAPARA